jgi:hypothetical protein
MGSMDESISPASTIFRRASLIFLQTLILTLRETPLSI